MKIQTIQFYTKNNGNKKQCNTKKNIKSDFEVKLKEEIKKIKG